MGSVGKVNDIERCRKLVKTVSDLSLAPDMSAVMVIVKEVARELTGSDGATFILKNGDKCFYADESSVAPLWKGREFPIEQCISGWVMKNKKELLISDVLADERVAQELYENTFVKSLLIVPIRREDPLGAIGTYWGKKHIATEEETELLQALADVTAVTVQKIQTYATLEERVKERTGELELLNQQLESFTYSVSHDLRAPLRGINGFMNILLEDHGGQLNEDAKKMADRVLQNAHQMTTLLDGLLTFFKMGQKEMVKTKLPMKLIVNEICDELREAEKRRYISINVKDLPEVEGDNVLMKQVWLNLISNAIKYSGKNLKTFIEVGFENKENEIIYYVKDNGVGFDMNYYPKLFGVFQRLHSQREFEGTGIGLAIVDRIIARHGGKVWAEGKVDEGAAFYFSLKK